MKKIVLAISIIFCTALLMANLDIRNEVNDLSLDRLLLKADAASEFDPIGSCNSWCYSGDVCVLRTNAGFNINCYGWRRP